MIKLSVIIPVHNGGEDFRRCLVALAASFRPPDELIVVDDGSSDGSGDVARQFGAHVVRIEGAPRGPAFARNRGAECAHGDLLVFLDADVAVHPDTLAQIEQSWKDHPELDALFASYDADPPARGLATRYKNLLHHYVHQHGSREASTFWAGCGAIDRQVFAALGGFDERYTRPAVEDIELGLRLKRAGYRVGLCPEIQVTHLKRWTLASLIRTDICNRAVPWTQLILQHGHLPDDLNLTIRSRWSALAAWVAAIGLFLGFGWPTAWLGALAGTVALIALNADLYRFFYQRGGPGFAVGATGLHALYLLYSSLVFGLMAVAHGRAGLVKCWRRLAPARRALVGLLALTLVKGWLWSIIVPVWLGGDEDQHFGYVQEFTRQRAWPVQPPEMVPRERALLWELLRPVAISVQREPFDFSPSGLSQIQALRRQLDTPAARTELVPTFSMPYFIRQHPPLYYTLLAPVHHLGVERSILVRIAWMRLVSVLMAVATVGCAYGAAHTLWPDRPWFPCTVATLVSFHPLFTFYTAIIGNAALEMLDWAAFTWLAAIIVRRGMNGRRGLALGGVMAAGLLTRSSFLAAWLLFLVLGGWDILRAKGRFHWQGWAAAIGTPVLLAGWWYLDLISTGGGEMVELYRSSDASVTAVPLLPYLRTYPWLTRYRPLLREWWGAFGFRDTYYPLPMYGLLELLTGLALVGWGWLGLRLLQRKRVSSGDRWMLAIGVISTVGLIAFYTALDYRMAQSGSWFKIQGRYYLAPVIAQMAALAVGWRAWGRRWMVLAMCVGMIGLNSYALAGVIAPRYYGEQIVVRYEPTGDPASLVPGLTVSRTFELEGKGLSRLDIWLSREKEAAPEATVIVVENGQEVVRLSIAASQMTAPYPTVLRFRPQPEGSHRYTVEVRGSGTKVARSEDGQLALKAYYQVPPLEMLTRMTIIQPAGYTVGLIVVLGSLYLLGLAAWLWAFLAGGLLQRRSDG